MGFLGAIVPEEYGGRGVDYRTYALIVEEVGRGCSAMRTVVSVVTSLVCSSIVRWGTEEQKKEWLPQLCSGESARLLRPDRAEHRLRRRQPLHARDAVGRRLEDQRGRSSGSRSATTRRSRSSSPRPTPSRPTAGSRPSSCRPTREGFTTSEIHDKLGLRGSDTAELSLDEVEVPDEALLGEVGDGFKVAMSALDSGRYSVAAGCVGICQGSVDASVAYAKEREQFGRPIASFQLVQELIADQVVQTEAARGLVWRAGWLKDAGKPNTTETSIAKLYATEAAVNCANNAIQVHGGSGYVDDYPVERYLRDARVTTLYEGTSQIQKLIIGRAATGINAMT